MSAATYFYRNAGALLNHIRAEAIRSFFIKTILMAFTLLNATLFLGNSDQTQDICKCYIPLLLSIHFTQISIH